MKCYIEAQNLGVLSIADDVSDLIYVIFDDKPSIFYYLFFYLLFQVIKVYFLLFYPNNFVGKQLGFLLRMQNTIRMIIHILLAVIKG